MLAKVKSGALRGVDAYLVEVEIDLSPGLPAFTTVGLPEAAVKESKDRVRAALKNSGYKFPDNRITINLAPADVRKEGTGFDLPVAVGILAAQGIVSQEHLDKFLVFGELSLDGRLKPTRGVLSIALATRQAGLALIIPRENLREAGVVQGIEIYGIDSLVQLTEFLEGRENLSAFSSSSLGDLNPESEYELDFLEVKGQEPVKRALLLAAAGGHNVLMIGAPGSGKTMLAQRIPGILPPLSFEEALETSKIYSVVGLLKPGHGLLSKRPFRSPHHTISDAGLIGGGHIPRPGEVSLAHNGLLFLDELPEFKRSTLEVLRQPLEDGVVTISRAATSITYPAKFMMVASMNSCFCGMLGDPRRVCSCTPRQIQQYRSRISGPLLDRIDIQMQVVAVPFQDLSENSAGTGSKEMRAQVLRARGKQEKRFAGTRIFDNAHMAPRMIKEFCTLGAESKSLLEAAVERFSLSARGYSRILKIARTIADLEGADDLTLPHVAEAIQYRTLDRQFNSEKGVMFLKEVSPPYSTKK